MTMETAEPAMPAAEPAAPRVSPPPKPQPSPELIGRLQALGIYPADGTVPAARPPPAGKPHLHHRTRWLIGLAVTVLLALAVSVVLLALARPPFVAAELRAWPASVRPRVAAGEAGPEARRDLFFLERALAGGCS